MDAGASRLNVLVPGLSRAIQACGASVTSSVLNRILERGRSTESQHNSFESLAFSMFELKPPSDSRELPVAAVSYFGATDQRPDGWCLRIDPAHLQTRLTKLYLIAGKPLAVSSDEAGALIRVIHELYREQGWRVETTESDQWYLLVPDDPGVTTTPITGAIGRDVDALLPAGANASWWHACMNEIQMAFHADPVNTERDTQGLYTINTVWPWGSGRLPNLKKTVWRRVWSDEPLTRGLAKLSKARLSPVPTDAADVVKDLSPESNLLVLGDSWSEIDSSDMDFACSRLQNLEQKWWRPLFSALKAGSFSALTVTDFGLGAVSVSRPDTRGWRQWLRLLTSK